jgi:hypothetical protein
MPATVPLSSPVKTMSGAQALAESVGVAGAGAPVGPAIDRIARFLTTLPYPVLRWQAENVLDVLHLLAAERADRLTDWLGRQAADVETAQYWFELNELTCLGLAV